MRNMRLQDRHVLVGIAKAKIQGHQKSRLDMIHVLVLYKRLVIKPCITIIPSLNIGMDPDTQRDPGSQVVDSMHS